MAKKDEKQMVITADKPIPQETAAEPAESKYKASELANISHKFKTSGDCITAAFKTALKTEATIAEAEKIINEFISKEVK